MFRTMGASSFGVLSIALLSPALAASLDFGITSAAVRRLALAFEDREGKDRGRAGKLRSRPGDNRPATRGDRRGHGPVAGRLVGLSIGHRPRGRRRTSAALRTMDGSESRPRGPIDRPEGTQRFGKLTLIQTLSTLALWSAAITLAARGSSLWNIVAVALLVTAVSAAACLLLARREVPRSTRFAIDTSMLRDDVRFSSGLFLVQISSMVAFQLDRVIVAALASPAAAGVYSICVGVANKSLFVSERLRASLTRASPQCMGRIWRRRSEACSMSCSACPWC